MKRPVDAIMDEIRNIYYSVRLNTVTEPNLAIYVTSEFMMELLMHLRDAYQLNMVEPPTLRGYPVYEVYDQHDTHPPFRVVNLDGDKPWGKPNEDR